MGNYTIFQMFENPRRGRQARNFTTNVPKILGLKWSSEQIFSENCRWVPLFKGLKKKFISILLQLLSEMLKTSRMSLSLCLFGLPLSLFPPCNISQASTSFQMAKAVYNKGWSLVLGILLPILSSSGHTNSGRK